MTTTTDRPLYAALFAASTVLCTSGTGGAQPPPAGFPADFVRQLEQSKQIYVATARKNGARSSAVPVWFGYLDGAIWFTTGPDSHKGKRVQRGSPMWVSTQSQEGPFIKTTATVVKDPALAERLGTLYSDKYWIAWLGLFRPSAARITSGKTILLRLTPAKE